MFACSDAYKLTNTVGDKHLPLDGGVMYIYPSTIGLSHHQYHLSDEMLRSSPTTLRMRAVNKAVDSSSFGIMRRFLTGAALVLEVTKTIEIVVSLCSWRR